MLSLALEQVELGEPRHDASMGCQLEAKGDKEETATATRLNEDFSSAFRVALLPLHDFSQWDSSYQGFPLAFLFAIA